MDHVGVVVDDLPAAIEFFVALGLEFGGQTRAEGEWVDASWDSATCGRTRPW